MEEPRAVRRFPLHLLYWFPEFLQLKQPNLRSQTRVLGLSLIVGVIAGIGAIVFDSACQIVFHYALSMGAGYIPPHAAGEKLIFTEHLHPLLPWLLVLLPALGGLLCGLIVFTLAPEAEGHGTDNVIDAYHRKQGRMRIQVPLVKIVASAITLGTGGSGGREGPIAQIGAGFGSFLAGLLKLRPAERRVLLAAGMGAGISAIFRAPLAGTLFAAEVLYRSPDFESEVILPAGLASVTAYSTFGIANGWKPLFAIPSEGVFDHPLHLLSYAVLALSMAILAMVYTRTFYFTTRIFHHLPILPHIKPMIGGLFCGLISVGLYFLFEKNVLVLSCLSFGYGVLQEALNVVPGPESSLDMATLLLAVSIGKLLTTSLTIGSGGSAGVFGPSMVIGGCGGGALGIYMNHLWPAFAPHPGNFVMVGMAGFFAAAAKTPFSTLIMVGEITGNYNLILPTMWVCIIAFLLSDEQSIYSKQMASRSLSPAHQGDYVRDVLAGMRVRDLLESTAPVPSVKLTDPEPVILKQLSLTANLLLPVTDVDGRLVGLIGIEEMQATDHTHARTKPLRAKDLMRHDFHPLGLDDHLERAMELFAGNDLFALPVINAPERQVVGMIRRSDVMKTYLDKVQGASQKSVSDMG